MIGIIDYGVGNLFSIKNALDYLSVDSSIIRTENEIKEADRLILPGVGAFPDAMKILKESGLDDIIRSQAKEKYIMGICLGMQLLFEKSYEYGETDGLGLIEGRVEMLKEKSDIKIPHIGWCKTYKMSETCPITRGVEDGEYFYFVHSYKAVMRDENIGLYGYYGQKIPGLVWKDNVFGCQFHPEKSGEAGIRILQKFAEIK